MNNMIKMLTTFLAIVCLVNTVTACCGKFEEAYIDYLYPYNEQNITIYNATLINSTGGGGNNTYYYNNTYYDNFTNSFNELFVNKISTNTSPFIELNDSFAIKKNSFLLYSPTYTSYMDISRDNLTLFYSGSDNVSSLDLKTKDASSEHYTKLLASNSLSYSYLYINPFYNIYPNYFVWAIGGSDEVLKVGEHGTTIHNKLILDELSGADQYLKVNVSNELYSVTPIITVGSDYTNLTRLVGTVYTNNNDYPIYITIRVGCLAAVGNLDCNIRLLNNNGVINQHFLSPMSVNQYYVHSFANIIPSNTNYTLVNNGTAQLLLYSWYENSILIS